MNVNCDECKKDFDIQLKELEHPAHRIKGYVTETYFRCPHCDRKYLVSVTDKTARKMQKEIKSFNEKFLRKDHSRLSDEEYEKIKAEHDEALEKMKGELLERMNNLEKQLTSL